MESTFSSISHSAKVRIELRCQSQAFNVAELCPGKLTLRNAVALPPCHGELHVFIDGHEDVQSIYLCEGITPGEKVVFI